MQLHTSQKTAEADRKGRKLDRGHHPRKPQINKQNRVEFTREALKDGRLAEVFGWMAGISVLMVAISSSLVVFVAPEAAGSGVPGVIGYLNGLCVCVLSVAAGAYVGTCSRCTL